jgi:hypothetical protein
MYKKDMAPIPKPHVFKNPNLKPKTPGQTEKRSFDPALDTVPKDLKKFFWKEN